MPNPYLPLWEYIPDGEPRVFGNRVYVYGSHDRVGHDQFCDYVLKCWSAPVDDLNHWTDHGVIFRTRDTFDHPADTDWTKEHNELYAPDVVEKDGKTYSLPFGYKQWSKAAIDGYPPYSVAAKGRFKGIEGPFQVAGSYAWASPDALQLKVHYVNWISALGLTLCFEDNKVLLTVTENYSSGEGVTFEGTLAH